MFNQATKERTIICVQYLEGNYRRWYVRRPSTKLDGLLIEAKILHNRLQKQLLLTPQSA